MNTNSNKKLSLKRETLRTLVVASGVRAGGVPQIGATTANFTTMIAPAGWTTILRPTGGF